MKHERMSEQCFNIRHDILFCKIEMTAVKKVTTYQYLLKNVQFRRPVHNENWARQHLAISSLLHVIWVQWNTVSLTILPSEQSDHPMPISVGSNAKQEILGAYVIQNTHITNSTNIYDSFTPLPAQ